MTHLEEQWIRNLGHKTSREKTFIAALLLGLQEVEASRISGQWEHEGGIVVSPHTMAAITYSPTRYLWVDPGP